jgi:chromosome segregation ATPase
MLRDRNKKLSHEMDKLKREYSYAQEKLEAQDLHLEMLEKTHRSARETLKAAEEEKFQAERAIRNAKTDAEMAVKRKDSQAVIENREMKMQVQSLERQLERAEDRVKAAELDAANALVKVNEEVEKRVKLEMDFQEKETKIKVKERDLRNKLEHSRQALHFILLATPQTLSKLLDAAEVTRDTGIIDQSTKPRDVEENLWLRVVDATASLNRLRNEDL